MNWIGPLVALIDADDRDHICSGGNYCNNHTRWPIS